MKIFFGVLMLIGSLAQANDCADWSGRWESEISGEVTELQVEQKECESALFHYRLKNGLEWTRQLIFDGKIRRQFEADWEALDEAFEWQGNLVKKWGVYEDRGDSTILTMGGYIREDGGQLVETTVLSDANGKEVDHDEVRFYRVP